MERKTWRAQPIVSVRYNHGCGEQSCTYQVFYQVVEHSVGK